MLIKSSNGRGCLVWYGAKMLEKRFTAIPPQLLTSSGTANGVITVADTRLFKVKQEVVLVGTTLPILDIIEIKRINTINQMIVGPRNSNINNVTDVSAYTLALNSSIFANEQKRPSIPAEEIIRAVYEEEPTTALRNMLVDKQGNDFDAQNPLPVKFGGPVNVHVKLTASDNDPNPGDIHDSIRIGNGVNELAVNPDGSINVVSGSDTSSSLLYSYNEALSVPAAVETTVLTVPVSPATLKRFQKVDVSGTNVAEIRLKVNNSIISKKRLWHGKFNTSFNFESFNAGLRLLNGDILTITVIHNRPNVGDFEATAWYL